MASEEPPLLRRVTEAENLQETNMRTLITTIVATVLITSAAVAQPAMVQNGPQNPAVKSPSANNSSNPVAGANSFTMAQAQSQIEAKGYTQVTGLMKDSNGIWRGTASKNGQPGPVSVDYQGNVN